MSYNSFAPWPVFKVVAVKAPTVVAPAIKFPLALIVPDDVICPAEPLMVTAPPPNWVIPPITCAPAALLALILPAVVNVPSCGRERIWFSPLKSILNVADSGPWYPHNPANVVFIKDESLVSWNIAWVLTNLSVPPTATACLGAFPSIISFAFFWLSGVTSPDALTNLIEFSLTYKSLKKFVLEPKLHLLVPSGTIEPVTTKATNASSVFVLGFEPEYIEPLIYVVPPKVEVPLDVILVVFTFVKVVNVPTLLVIVPLELISPEDVILPKLLTFKLPKEPVNAVIVPLELKFPLEVILPVIKCLSVDPFPKVTPPVVTIVLELIPTEAVIPPTIVKDPIISAFPLLEPSHSAVTPVIPEPSPDIDTTDIVPLELTFPVMLIFAKELVLAIVKLFAVISPLELIVALAVIWFTVMEGTPDNPVAFPDKEPVSVVAIIVLPLIILPVIAPFDIVNPEAPSITKLLNEPVPSTLKFPLDDKFSVEILFILCILLELINPLALILPEAVTFEAIVKG